MPRSPAKEGPFKTLPNWAALMESFGPAMQEAIDLFQQFGNDVAKKGAETAQSVSAAITQALEAFGALASYDFAKGTPTGDKLGLFSALIAAVVTMFENAANAMSGEGLKAATEFATAAKDMGAAIGPALDGLKGLSDFDFSADSPTGEAMGWFFHLVESLVANTVAAAAMFDSEGLTAASAFAKTAKDVADFIGPSLEALKALARYDFAHDSPTGSAMGWFFHLVESLVQNTVNAAAKFTAEGLAAASTFAKTAKDVADFIGPSLLALKALANFDFAKDSPTGSAMGWFFLLVQSLVQNAVKAATLFTTEGLKAATDFANAAKAVAEMIPPALTALAGMRNFVGPTEASMDAVLASIRYIVRNQVRCPAFLGHGPAPRNRGHRPDEAVRRSGARVPERGEGRDRPLPRLREAGDPLPAGDR
jgi:hypothetical protein